MPRSLTGSVVPLCRGSSTGVFAAVGAILTAGCNAGGDHAAGPEVFTIHVPGDEYVLSPAWDMSPQFLVFLPLAVTNPDGSIEPALAERWEHSEDHREWTFYIRPGVTWHDGVPVTAHDVDFTLRLRSRPELGGYSSFIESSRALDDRTVRIRFRRPVFTVDTWLTFLPRHLLEDLDSNDVWSSEFWKAPVGNGPYRYVRHVPQTLVELEANPDYYRGPPRIARVALRFGGDKIVELLSGHAQAVSMVNLSDVPKIRGDARFEVYFGYAEDWTLQIYWNHRHPALGEARVRRALTHALDRRGLARALGLRDDVRLSDVVSTRRLEQRRALPPALPYDPDSAGRLLSEAGWRDTDGDGVRDRDGEPLRFTAIVAAGGSFEGNGMPFAAVFAQAAYRAVGVQMEIQSLEPTVVMRRVRDGDFDAALMRLWNEPSEHMRWMGPESPAGYYNPEVHGLLEAASAATTPEEQDRIYLELIPQVQADMPFTILFPQVYVHVADRRLRGLSAPYRADPVWYLEYLWWEVGNP